MNTFKINEKYIPLTFAASYLLILVVAFRSAVVMHVWSENEATTLTLASLCIFGLAYQRSRRSNTLRSIFSLIPMLTTVLAAVVNVAAWPHFGLILALLAIGALCGTADEVRLVRLVRR